MPLDAVRGGRLYRGMRTGEGVFRRGMNLARGPGRMEQFLPFLISTEDGAGLGVSAMVVPPAGLEEHRVQEFRERAAYAFVRDMERAALPFEPLLQPLHVVDFVLGWPGMLHSREELGDFLRRLSRNGAERMASDLAMAQRQLDRELAAYAAAALHAMRS